MKKNNWIYCCIISIICRLLGLALIFGFVFGLVWLTGNLACLWLLFLLFAVEWIPVYEFSRRTDDDKSTPNN